MKKKKVFSTLLSLCVDNLFPEANKENATKQQNLALVNQESKILIDGSTKSEISNENVHKKEIISEEEFNRLMKLSKLTYKQFLQICDYNESKKLF
jgi:hypothetical protein